VNDDDDEEDGDLGSEREGGEIFYKDPGYKLQVKSNEN
jgi:hypothetical protein